MIPLLVGSALVYGAYRAVKHRRGMTNEREIIYKTALNSVKDPAKLRSLAAAFKDAGLKEQAELLEKRATLRELPKETKDARREAFRKAMASVDVKAVRAVAAAFEAEGATGAADALRTYANSVKDAKENLPPVPAPSPPTVHEATVDEPAHEQLPLPTVEAKHEEHTS